VSTKESLASNDLTTSYATFWQRFAASLLDALVLMPIGIVIGIGLFLYFGLDAAESKLVDALSNIFAIIATWLYYALLESSKKQATWSKRVMKIRVSDLSGQRISFGRATLRYFGSFISSLILFIGYFMMLWTAKKQTLHDLMTGSLVTQDTK